jgi:diaminohydroxyphosphoribosylaminopyrimidine deaminase/5-amino-6-(5-phosphoribosylamino)uracil reductase
MRRALQLARRGQGRVEPNPMVGCVIARGARVVAEGHHRRFGGPHAEVAALDGADGPVKGATVFVTLEPCAHQGKTPPCADALIRAGVRRVVAAMRDPNPLVAGRGFRRLRAAGVAVSVGLLHEEARDLMAPFVAYHLRRRPYVILKWAQSIDGKIATRTGESKWISGPASRREAHRLRARVDAVVVGVETVLADDPDLTAREAPRRRVAHRVILDAKLRTPLGARVVRTARRAATLLVCGGAAPARRRRALERLGCEVLAVPARSGRIRLDRLMAALHARGMTNVLVEGGGCVLGAFVEAGLADEARIFVAPKLIGGETAPGPLRQIGPAVLAQAPRWNLVRRRCFGVDVCYTMKRVSGAGG